ncbi:hypothetical protein [Paracidovorax cattleyae]|uniref:hypothetical protein n=1 Tax=Paracidovorax cattleyae TaxID=80868 RepID=UPI0018AFF865|nr:hypothetical protein [Paracidovorax cattleyae]MBF9263387.1 hypothetical protein [Paracidovorax cattleyae]
MEPIDQDQLYESFRAWLFSPGAIPQAPSMEDSYAAIQSMMEAALWAAYRAGHREAVAHGDGARTDA